MEQEKTLDLSVTIGICTAGRWEHLSECLHSLSAQDFEFDTLKILLPLTPTDYDVFSSRLADFSNLNIETLPVEHYSAISSRNLFIKKVQTGILYFLDEDCSLPGASHLKDLVAYHVALPKVSVIGGRYLNSAMTSYLGKAYNLVCDVWQDRNDFFSESKRLKHLLGGNLSVKINKETKKFLFGTEVEFGGEELSYLKQVQKAGLRVMLVNGLSVYHNSSHNLESFFSRAWVHGSNKYVLEQEQFGSVINDRKLFFSKTAKWDELALAGAYLGVVQAAYYNRGLQMEWAPKALSKWTQSILKKIQ